MCYGGRVIEELPEELATWPTWTPDEAQLGELELLISGAFPPLAGYLTTGELAATAGHEAPGALPVTLTVPACVVPPEADHLVLTDPEGSPLAVLEITERIPLPGPGGTTPLSTPRTGPGGTTPLSTPRTDDSLRLAGPVTELRAPEYGPFRAMRRPPAEVRAELGDAPVLALAVRGPVTQRHIGQLRYLAARLRTPEVVPRMLLLPLVAGPARVVGRPEALVRAVRAAARQLPDGTLVVPVPLPPRSDPGEELHAQAIVARAHGATHLIPERPPGSAGVRSRSVEDLTVVTEGEWAY